MIYKFSLGLDGYIYNSIVQESTLIDIDNVTEAIKATYTPVYIEAFYSDGRRVKIEDVRMWTVFIEDENQNEYSPINEWYVED